MKFVFLARAILYFDLFIVFLTAPSLSYLEDRDREHAHRAGTFPPWSAGWLPSVRRVSLCCCSAFCDGVVTVGHARGVFVDYTGWYGLRVFYMGVLIG